MYIYYAQYTGLCSNNVICLVYLSIRGLVLRDRMEKNNKGSKSRSTVKLLKVGSYFLQGKRIKHILGWAKAGKFTV